MAINYYPSNLPALFTVRKNSTTKKVELRSFTMKSKVFVNINSTDSSDRKFDG